MYLYKNGSYHETDKVIKHEPTCFKSNYSELKVMLKMSELELKLSELFFHSAKAEGGWYNLSLTTDFIFELLDLYKDKICSTGEISVNSPLISSKFNSLYLLADKMSECHVGLLVKHPEKGKIAFKRRSEMIEYVNERKRTVEIYFSNYDSTPIDSGSQYLEKYFAIRKRTTSMFSFLYSEYSKKEENFKGNIGTEETHSIFMDIIEEFKSPEKKEEAIG